MSATPGRPAFEPTEKDRATAKMMAAFGIPQYDIAKVIGVSEPTLRKHFRDELEVAHIEATAKVAQNLFRKATGDGKEAVAAAIFWLRARGGWRDRDPAPVDEGGKKEQRDRFAHTAERGTRWEKLLDPSSTRVQ